MTHLSKRPLCRRRQLGWSFIFIFISILLFFLFRYRQRPLLEHGDSTPMMHCHAPRPIPCPTYHLRNAYSHRANHNFYIFKEKLSRQLGLSPRVRIHSLSSLALGTATSRRGASRPLVSKCTSWQSSRATPLINCETTKSSVVPGGPRATMGACHVPAPYVTACASVATNAFKALTSGGPLPGTSSPAGTGRWWSASPGARLGATTTR